MENYVINVAEIESLQMINNTQALDVIFIKARRTVISGGTVLLVRKGGSGPAEKFDEINTEEDLSAYKKGVYKYLS